MVYTFRVALWTTASFTIPLPGGTSTSDVVEYDTSLNSDKHNRGGAKCEGMAVGEGVCFKEQHLHVEAGGKWNTGTTVVIGFCFEKLWSLGQYLALVNIKVHTAHTANLTLKAVEF